MEIVLVNTCRVINAKGGTEKVFCDMANALDAMGHNVTAVCLDDKKGMPGFPISDSVQFINAKGCENPIYCRGLLKKIRAFSLNRDERRRRRREIECSWNAKLLRKAIENIEHVDICVSFQPETTYLLSRLQCLAAPIITMFHCQPQYLFLKMKRNMEEIELALRSSKLITVLLPRYVSEVKNLYSDASVIAIPNAIPSFEKVSLLNSKKIVCVGRLAEEKRVELLIKAFAIAANKIPDWNVEFWGETNVDPAYREKILQLVEDLNLQGRFVFCGVTNDVENVLESAAIFAFPSVFEGFPLALGEAMAKGLPVIGCKDCAGSNEMIEDKVNGLLVEPTSNDLANALISLAKDQCLRQELGLKAREYAKGYSPEVIWSMWNDLICKIVHS